MSTACALASPADSWIACWTSSISFFTRLSAAWMDARLLQASEPSEELEAQLGWHGRPERGAPFFVQRVHQVLHLLNRHVVDSRQLCATSLARRYRI